MSPVMILVLSLGVGVAALVVGWRVRRTRREEQAPPPAGGPAAPLGRGAFLYGELPERRAEPRRDAGGASVSLSDAPDHVTPIPATVIDVSPGGVRLELAVPVAVGTAVWVRREGVSAWQGYRVCWCRKGTRNYDVGCKVDPTPPAA